VKTDASNARVLKKIKADKQGLANGVAPEVIAARVTERDWGRRAHLTAQERAVAVGLGVKKLEKRKALP